MRVRAAAVLLLAAACACGRRPQPGADLDTAAESYVRIVLALAQRDPDSLDQYHGPAAWRADAEALRAPLAGVQQSARTLAVALSGQSAGDQTRREFLVRQLRAVDARIDVINGKHQSFDIEFSKLFGVIESSPASRGSSGSEGSRGSGSPIATMQNRGNLTNPGNPSNPEHLANPANHIPTSIPIPPNNVKKVVEAAIDACRTATSKHVALPREEHVTVEFVPDLSWSAFTDYLGGFRSRIRVNARMPMTVDDALELACHEAYPGHHTINVLLDAKYGKARTEFLIQPLFSPQSLLHEGAASVAPELAFTDEERIALERDTLFPIAGLDPAGAERGVRETRARQAARDRELGIVERYLDGELDFPRASLALAREMPSAGADGLLKFVNEFRTYYATYTVGEARAGAWIGAHGPDRWRAYEDLVASPGQVLPDAPATAARTSR